MAIIDELRALAHDIRAIPDEVFGLRPHTVEILHRTYSTGDAGLGTRTDVATPITHARGASPRVRWLRPDELALAPDLKAGAIEVGPITPQLAAELGTLRGSGLPTGAIRHLRITGPMHPEGAVYRITRIDASKALHWMIQAEPVGVE